MQWLIAMCDSPNVVTMLTLIAIAFALFWGSKPQLP